MIINKTSLDALRKGFQTSFQAGLSRATSQAAMVATTVNSTTGEEKYGWLGKIPSVREWIGDRVIHNISTSDYAIKNKDWELTLGVNRNDIEDDTLGIYAPLFEEMGQSTGALQDTLVFSLLKNGFSTNCYDGQSFFDTDHPVLMDDGSTSTFANTDGGAGTPWFLLCTNRTLKPIIWQTRKAWQFVNKDQITDENLFSKKEFVYGADSRANVGYGFPQMAWGSKQTLDATSYGTARAGLAGMKGDHGRPLGLMPNLLVVPPALESAGRKLLNSEYGTGGVTNEWKGTAELLVCPWLA
jgi:phage major head subunit gpT-like protein